VTAVRKALITGITAKTGHKNTHDICEFSAGLWIKEKGYVNII
jgi:hypothetical protein